MKLTNFTILLFLITLTWQSCTPYLGQSNGEYVSLNEEKSIQITTIQRTTTDKKATPITQLIKDDNGWINWLSLTKGVTYEKLWLINIYPEPCTNCQELEESLNSDNNLMAFINENFLPIKVTSLEKPDWYKISQFMASSQVVNSSTAAITILALPDGTPFWSGSMSDLTSWNTNIRFFAKQYRISPENLRTTANKVAASNTLLNSKLQINERLLSGFTQKLKVAITDKEDISTESYRFLLRYYHLNKNLAERQKIVDYIAELTNQNWILLDKFAATTDVLDEKYTLAYQAQLMSLFTEAYQVTKDRKYKKACYQILNFMQEKMWNKHKIAFTSYPMSDDPKHVLTAWNSMVLKSCIESYKVFGEERFLGQALGIANYLKYSMIHHTGAVWHSNAQVQAGYLDDYSMTADALLALYQVTFNEEWLLIAQKVIAFSLPLFQQNTSLNYQQTNLQLLNFNTNIADVIDHSTHPSANAIYSKVLYELGILFHNEEYKAGSKQIVENSISNQAIQQNAISLSSWAMICQMMMSTPYEVAIIGNDFKTTLKQFNNHYLPYVLFYGGKNEGKLEGLQGKLIPGETNIYICQGKTCNMPTAQVEEAMSMMK